MKASRKLAKQELDELIEFKELLENKGSKDSYKKMPDEDKGADFFRKCNS